jgi:hypothetical protein
MRGTATPPRVTTSASIMVLTRCRLDVVTSAVRAAYADIEVAAAHLHGILDELM